MQPATSVFARLRQEDHEFETRLDYRKSMEGKVASDLQGLSKSVERVQARKCKIEIYLTFILIVPYSPPYQCPEGTAYK